MARLKLVVVGGGITGLAAAHRAVELARERSTAVDLTLIEARARLGGTIATEHAGGFLVEGGPDSFLSEKPWALALCRRLGIEDRLVRTDDRFRRTFVVFRGQLHPLPDGFQLLAPTRLIPFVTSRLFSWPGKLRMALDLALPRGGDPDESLGAFVRRRLGREALERVAQPLVAGIYTADPDELSLAATMPRFLELERKERSLILALWHASRRALVALRDLRGGDGGADPRAGPPAPARCRAAEGSRHGHLAGGRPLAAGDGGRCHLYGRCRRARPRVPPGGADDALPRSRAGPSARRHSVRLVGHRDARLPPRRHPASTRRLRLRRAADRAAAHHRLYVFQREVPGAGAVGPCAPARVHGRRAQ